MKRKLVKDILGIKKRTNNSIPHFRLFGRRPSTFDPAAVKVLALTSNVNLKEMKRTRGQGNTQILVPLGSTVAAVTKICPLSLTQIAHLPNKEMVSLN